MPVLIEKHRRELSAVCRRYRVQRLDLFGSAATPRFDPAASDLDFVVVFADEAASGLADRYLDLAETLERIFQRRVDLLTERSIRNPYFKQTVESTRQGVYEHPGEVDDMIVWDVVQSKVPGLRRTLQAVLDE